MINQSRIRHTARIVHFLHTSLLVINHIGNVRHRSDHVHVKFAVQTFLNNLHVKQAQESATETKAQRQRRLRLESQRSIVQLKFFQGSTEVFIILGLNRINSGKHHRLHFLKSFNGFLAGTGNVSDRIPHLHLTRSLDTRNDISYVPRTEFLSGHHIHLQHTDFVCIIFLTGIEELHLISCTDHSVHHLEISNDSAE